MKRIHFMCLEDMVPQNHLLRAIEKAIDWSFIYDEVKGLYVEERWGNPGIDPVSLIKIVMIQYIYGIPSMRQTIRKIEVNNAYRWFIGYDIDEPVPRFSTFGKNNDLPEQIYLSESSHEYWKKQAHVVLRNTHKSQRQQKEKPKG